MIINKIQKNNHIRRWLPRNTTNITKFNKTATMATKIVSEYDQEKPQSQTADKPLAPRGRATKQSRDTRKTN